MVPRVDDSVSVLLEIAVTLSPLSIAVYALSNDAVGHAARVQARFGPAVSVAPDTENEPLQTLQSVRVDRRLSPNVIA